MVKPRILAGLLGLLLTAGTAGVALAQSPLSVGRIGPAQGLLNDGRQLHPFGRLTPLGNFPTGGAVTPDGRFYWTVSTGRGPNDVRIVSVASGQVIQTLPLPGASGGIVMDPTHSVAYVSGVAQSPYKDQKPPPGTPGAGGDVIHVYHYDSAGTARFDHVIGVPPPSSARVPQSFPPTNMQKISWPDRLAISPDGHRLLVPLNLADQAAVIDVGADKVRYVPTGNYPYGAAISRDGRLGFVSNETPGTVSVIDMASARKVTDVQVGGHLSHPEALVADPHADRVYVAVTNADEVAVIDTASLTLAHTVSVGRSQGLGTAPNALTVTPDGRQLVVAESGADELAVISLPGAPGAGAPSVPEYSLIGRIPTAQYPSDVRVTPGALCPTGDVARAPGRARSPVRRHRHHQARRHRAARRPLARARRARREHAVRGLAHLRPHRRRLAAGQAPAQVTRCAQLLYVAGKGLGTGPNLDGPAPTSPNDTDDLINATQYLPLINFGSAGVGPYPALDAVHADTGVADTQVRPANSQDPPADTPLRAGGPIKHVFYIVRENRTYDQVLGDDPRGDGDPRLALFGANVTPNAHSLDQRFPLLDHYYANSEASIDGHFWTSAASVSDYVNKNWFQNYAGRGRPYDFGVYSVTWPANGFLFDQADRQGISYFNYGEAIAGTVPLTDKDRTQAETQRVATKFSKSDLGAGPTQCYPNDASIGKDAITGQTVFDSTPPLTAPPGSESRFDCFSRRFTSQLATNSVPTFNYLVLSNDHTRVLDPKSFTPNSYVADNDYGLGQIVGAITHSSVWSSSAIFVTEDDSQDGADHVDAHRTIAYVISPYTKPGAVIHTRYDMLSMTRSMELIMGMRPLALGDALATPMYDAFQSRPVNGGPYDPIAPKVSVMAPNPPAASPAQARALRFQGLDQITQRLQDRLLWRSVHGVGSAPPPPGPNAVTEPAAGRRAPDG